MRTATTCQINATEPGDERELLLEIDASKKDLETLIEVGSIWSFHPCQTKKYAPVDSGKNDEKSVSTADALKMILEKDCDGQRPMAGLNGAKKPVPPNIAHIFVNSRVNQGALVFSATYNYKTGHYTQIKNEIAEGLTQYAKQQSDKAVEEQRQRQIADARKAYEAQQAGGMSAFAAKFDIKSIDDTVLIQRNPFRYKGKVSFMRAYFNRMLDENRAQFTGADMGAGFVLDNVPTTRFRDGELVVVAARVTGVEQIPSFFGTSSVFKGDYVDSAGCGGGCLLNLPYTRD